MNRDLRNIRAAVATLLLALLLGGCASTPTEDDGTQASSDPWEGVNRQVFAFNETLDAWVAKPLADAYIFVTPGFARDGVTNFFDNLGEPANALNNTLQGKPGAGLQDTGRFLINSTVGIVGLVDVATPMGLESSNEDFGQTLAVWGTPEGMYLMLPAMGPSTTRDVVDYPVAFATNPITYVAAPVAVPLYVLDLVNTRANLEAASRFRNQAALDPYTFTRSGYRQYRNGLIWDGDPPQADFFDELDSDEELEW